MTLESLQSLPQDKLFLLTLTWPTPGVDSKTSSAAINKLNTNVLKKWNIQWIKVIETHKSGATHAHIVLALPWCTKREVIHRRSINTRADQSTIEQSYTGRVLALSQQLRRALKTYGFGHWNMAPVHSMEKLSSYLMKQTEAALGARTRRWSCSRKLTVCKGPIAPVSERARAGRSAMHFLAYGFGCNSMEELRDLLGKRWFYILRPLIINFTENIRNQAMADICEHVKWRVTANLGGNPYTHGSRWSRIMLQILHRYRNDLWRGEMTSIRRSINNLIFIPLTS